MSTVQATPTDQATDLARYGYRQELERTLGSFSSFAAGFSYISILTGVFQLFALGFGFGGPAAIWTWPLVFVGQLAVAFCFAEMSGQFPLAGGVYQWSRRVSRPVVSWMAGWIMAIGAIVTAAAVAVAYQVILPLISLGFQFVGSDSDAGQYSTPGGAKNAIVLGIGLVVFTTIVNLAGIKPMAKINNLGVFIELTAASLLVIFLAFHIKRGPQVVFKTLGTGAIHSNWGYTGAFLAAAIMSAYVFYGFDTAGMLAEESLEPRRDAPRAIIRAITAAFIVGGLLMLVGMMAVKDINDPNLSSNGMPYLVKSTLGNVTGDIFLACSAIAITVCCLAVQTAAIRLIFSMARDGALPFGRSLSKVAPKAKTPAIPALLTGILTIVLLAVNIGNQRVFTILTSVAIILFYIPYLLVTAPMLVRRLRGGWPRPGHGPYFNLGRWGLPINIFAVLYGFAMIVNLAWPRTGIYGNDTWYYHFGGFVFTAAVIVIGAAIYLFRRGRILPVQETEAGDLVTADAVPEEA